MIKLIIDNKDVFLDDNISIKLNYENPYFTKSSNYSLDIEIPMSLNHHIFGNIYRLDVTKNKISLPAMLYDNNKIVLNGTAVLLSVDNKCVKIQLVGGNAEFNFYTNDKIYIDEIDLGSINKTFPLDGNKSDLDKYFNNIDEYDGVLSYVKVGDDLLNSFCFLESGYSITTREYAWTYVQPYLSFIIRKIVEHFGYTIGDNYMDHNWMRFIYIVSWYPYNRNGNNLCKCLPHWTVSDFFDKLEKFAGVIFVVNEKDKTVDIKDINSYFSDEKTFLFDIVDEFECSIEDDGNNDDITTGNTEYNLSSIADNGYNKLNSDIFEHSTILKASTFDEMYSKWESSRNKASTLFICKNRFYINFIKDGKDTLLECNQYADLIRDDSTTEVKNSLDIVPAAIEQIDVGFWKLPERGTRLEKISSLFVNVPVSSYDPGFGRVTITSIQDYIDGKEQIAVNKSKKNILEIALYTGLIKVNSTVSDSIINIPSPFMDCNQSVDNQVSVSNDYSLSLNNVSPNSLGSRHLSLKRISSDKEYKIRFISDKVPKINSIFIIKNKRYIALKIETELNSNGTGLYMQGTFYRID